LNGQCARLARAHVEHCNHINKTSFGVKHSQLTALVPTLDDLTLANVEAQGLASVVAGIELLATILEGTAVVNLNLVACCASLVSVYSIS
jgi:hypothetical protein